MNAAKRQELIEKHGLKSEFPAPALHTSTTFMANREDPFGDGPMRSAKIKRAREIAEAEGVSIEGKQYSTQLADKPLDPNAWYSDKDELKKKIIEKGAGCEDLGIKAPEIIQEEKPYEVDEKLVRREASEIAHEAGISPYDTKAREQIAQEVRESAKGTGSF